MEEQSGRRQVYAVVVVTDSEQEARKLASTNAVYVGEPWRLSWDDEGLDTAEIICQHPEADF